MPEKYPCGVFMDIHKEKGQMDAEKTVLCGARAYEEKFYFNEAFESLPESIQEELKIMCVLYTNDVGGVLVLEFDGEGTLCFRTEAAEDDFGYDEIGSVLKIREMQREKEALLTALEMYYQVFFLSVPQQMRNERRKR